MPTLYLGFLASHSGSNFQAIVNAIKRGDLNANPCVLVSNNSNAFVIERAKREGIPYYHLSSKQFPDENELDQKILETLIKHNVDTVVLAGYMKKVGRRVLSYFHNRVLNIHPALLPKFGGKGMFGRYVHEAVIKSGEKESGCTVHLVDENYDQGKILAQVKVPVFPNDTPESLAERILVEEHSLYPKILQKIANGEIKL